MSRTFPDQFSHTFVEPTQEERKILDKFQLKLKMIDHHLSVSPLQPANWRSMGVEILYGKDLSFRYVATLEAIEEIANAEQLPELFESEIRSILGRLQIQQATTVGYRVATQSTYYYN